MEKISFKISKAVLLWCFLCLSLPANIFALDAGDLSELDGYTIIAVTSVRGSFNGADYDRLVELDNGMIFRFNEYNYIYSYNPDAAVFAKHYPVELVREFLPNARRGLTSYKLLIDDKIYDVSRVR